MSTGVAPLSPIPDVQAKHDSRQIAIDKVGVRDIRYPITLATKCGKQQSTVAMVNMYVSLPHHQKGTHMSRFLEILNESAHPLTPQNIHVVAETIRERLDAQHAHLELSFPYFIEKLAPETKTPGLMDYEVTMTVESNKTSDFVLGVKAPATSLCPCSKEISAYGAHNQRCEIEASVRFDPSQTVWIEDLVAHLEASASSDRKSVV